MSQRYCPPVLFLIFNRPNLTEKVFATIRNACPERLYIAADGPRQGVPGENDLCEETRKVALEVDWPCDVKTLFREEHLGCGNAVAQAITWFFEQESEGIILEDDCLPHPTFFRFCDELLELYRDDKRVSALSGDNFQIRIWDIVQSYYFSLYFQGWGWATWRRAWDFYDFKMSQWPILRTTSWLKELLIEPAAARFWQNIFDQVHGGRLDTWDFQWTYSCWIQNALTILPSVNLVTNIGHDDLATHTLNAQNALSNIPVHAMEFPLRHPFTMIRDFEADRSDSRYVFGIRPFWSQQTHSLLSFGYRHLPKRIQKFIRSLRAKTRNRWKW